MEGALLQGDELVGRGDVAVARAGHLLVGLREEAAGAAAGVVDGLADAGVDDADHGADELARREELAAVAALLAHLEQQAFGDLREGEDMRGVDHRVVDLVEIQVTSGTYCGAPAQLERRMMSQICLTAALTVCWVGKLLAAGVGPWTHDAPSSEWHRSMYLSNCGTVKAAYP